MELAKLSNSNFSLGGKPGTCRYQFFSVLLATTLPKRQGDPVPTTLGRGKSSLLCDSVDRPVS
jgi:hypothetical protein